VQGSRGVYQITERTLWGKRDQIAAKHVGRAIGRTQEFLAERNLQASDSSHIYDKYRILSIESFFRSCTFLPPRQHLLGLRAMPGHPTRAEPRPTIRLAQLPVSASYTFYSQLGWFLVWRKRRQADILFSLRHGHLSKHLHLAGAQEPCLCQALGGEPGLWMLRFRP
jgi:hypothetical protein